MQRFDLPLLEIEPMCDFEFTLYVRQRREAGRKTVDSVQRLCELNLKSRYKLTIVDIDDAPEEAERSRILATPTLVVTKPLPQRRVIGSFERSEELARAMGLVFDGAWPPDAPRDAMPEEGSPGASQATFDQ